MSEAPDFDGLATAVVVLEGDRVTRANRAAGALLEVDPGALAGRPLEALLVAEDLPRVVEAWRDRDTAVLRIRLRDEAGREVPVQVRAAVLPDGRRVLSARDVSALVRAETLVAALGRLPHETRADPEALLEAAAPVFRALGWGLAVVRREGEAFLLARLLPPPGAPDMEAAARRLEGRRVEASRSTLLTRLVDLDDALLVEDAPEVLARFRGDFAFLAPMLAAQEIRAAILAPMRRRGALEGGLLVLGRSLTEWDVVAAELFAGILAAAGALRGLEAELVARERLATVGAVAAELGDLVARTLDRVARTTWTLAAPEGDDTARRLLDILREESERLTRLAHELMAFARPLDPRPRASDPRRLVEAAVARALEAVGEDVAPPAVAVDEDLPPVRVDPRLAAQALAQVIENALEHAPPGGVTVTAAPGPEGLRVSVLNDGPPIPDADAPRLFEPFFTTKAMGTGLGLAVARRTLAEAGGRLDLVSTGAPVGFALTLPLTRDDAGGGP